MALVIGLVGGAALVAEHQLSALQDRGAAHVRLVSSGEDFTPAKPFSIADPGDDARDLAVTTLSEAGQCTAACDPILPGVKGPNGAGFELLAVGLAEDRPEAFVLSLLVAELRPEFPGLYATSLSRWVGTYFVCWRPGPELAERCANVEVTPHPGGAIVQSSLQLVGASACNALAWCSWSIPVEVKYGAPGEFLFTIPKEYATFDEAPSALVSLRASSGWWSTNGVAPRWHTAMTAHAYDQHQHQHLGLLEPSNVADSIPPSGTLVPLGSASGSYPVDPTEPILVASRGAISGAGGLRDHAELDVLAVDFRQEGSTLVAAFQFEGFEAMPEWDLQVAAKFMVKGGAVWNEIGIIQSGGEAYGYAGRCISNGCHDGYLVRVPFDIEAGRPGIIEVQAPRETWPMISDGDVTSFFTVASMYGEASLDMGPAGAPTYGNVHSGSFVDGAIGGTPYVFGSSHAGVFASPEHAHGH